jgi:hypothetical protein
LTYSIFLFEPEESLADKTINDSAIEISPPALEKKEEEVDHGVADKPDVEAVEPAMGGESAVVVEDTPEEMSYTQVDGTHVEGEWRLAWVVQYRNLGSSSSEAKEVVPAESEGAVVAETDPLPQEESHTVLTTEAQELPKAPAGAAERVEIDQVIEGQPPAEATTDVPVAEVNEPDGGSGAVGGVDQEETAHEAESVAAEINNGTHEAVVADDEPRATVAVEEANGNEATLEQLDEQPEVTVHVETAPFVEEPQADEVVVATVVDEPAGEGVAASVEDKADVEQAEEEVRGEVVGEDIPAVVEAVPVNEAVVEESQASVVSEETPAVEAAVEETPASVDAEPVVEIASKDTPARVEAGPAEVAIEATPDPVEHDPAIHEDVASAPVEVEVASEESPALVTSQVEVAIEETSVSVEAKPVVEATREETAVAESAVEENPAPGEPIVEIIATEETPAQGEVEPVVGVTATDEAPAPVEAEPVVSEVSPVVVEAEPTDAVATTNETPAPIEAESADEVTTNEETTVEAEPVVSEESLVVVEAESTVEVANTEATLASGGAEPVVTDETPAPVEAEPVVAEEIPVAVEAVPVYSGETLAPIEAEHVVSAVTVEAEPAAREAPFTDSKPTTDISREEVPAPVEAELIASETTTADTKPAAEVTEEATPVAAEPSAEVASQDVPVLVEAISTPETVSEETSTAANEVVPESEITSEILAPIEASGVAETELVTTEIAQEDVPAQAVETEPALADVRSEAVNSIISVEADNTPVGVGQEEVAVQGAPAAVNSLGDTLVQVADAEPEIAVEPMLKEQGVFEAGIKNDTEVALEDASVALATNSVDETSPAVSSESTKEPNVEAVLEEQPATESGHLSADVLEPSIKEDVPAEEPVEDAVRAEPLTGLKTEDLYIQTSVDTTTFTPIVDSGIDVCMNHSWISISLTRRSSRSQNHNPRVCSALLKRSNDRNRLGHLSK